MGEARLHQHFVRCGHVVADAFGRLIQRPAASVGRSVAASSVGHSADRGGALVVMAMAIRVAAEFVAPMMLSLVLTLAVVPLGAARTATRMGGDASRRYGAGLGVMPSNALSNESTNDVLKSFSRTRWPTGYAACCLRY